VTAVDFSAEMLEQAQRNLEAGGLLPRVTTLQADVRAIPFEDASFDAIVCMEVLEHLPGHLRDVRQVLREFARVLKDGGKLLVEVPLEPHGEMIRAHDDFVPRWNAFQPDELEIYQRVPLPTQNPFQPEAIQSLLEQGGFDVEGTRFIRVLPSGLIERYPLLERFDHALAAQPDTARLAREAIWVAVRIPRNQTHESHNGKRRQPVIADPRDPLHETLCSLQRTLANETDERRRQQALAAEECRRAELAFEQQSQSASRAAAELQAARQALATEQEAHQRTAAAERLTRRQLENELAAQTSEAGELRARVAALEAGLKAAERGRAGLRVILAREQQARRILESSVTEGYVQILDEIGKAVAAATPKSARVLVITKGDETLLNLSGRKGWHFPRAADGGYAGYYPATSEAAIEHLEALRTYGADYLVFPSTMFWWFDHYHAFREHLDRQYRRVLDDGRFVIFDLRGPSSNGESLRWPGRVAQWAGGLLRPRMHDGGRRKAGDRASSRGKTVNQANQIASMLSEPVGMPDEQGVDEICDRPIDELNVPTERRLVRSSPEEFGRAVIFAAVPYDDIGGGQRPAQLTRALLRRRWHVTYLYIYPSRDTTTGSILESCIDLPRLEHRSVDEITPGDLLESIHCQTPLIFEAPHQKFLPFLELASKRGLPTTFELIDDWETSLGAGWFDRSVQQQFVARCTTCVGTARLLVEKLRAMGAREPQYIPNAADESVFDAYHRHSRPADYPSDYRRTLLYFGSMYGDWFAWDYLRAAAEENREDTFVMIGAPPRTHKLPSNVVFLGPKQNSELPAYLAHADAALIPFLPGQITDAVSPIKVFEYLFLKKPVIATQMPELEGYPHVHRARDPAKFASLCAAVPTASSGKELTNDLDLFISRNSWNQRLDRLLSPKAPARRFSFVIVMHNNRSIIERCLTTLSEHTQGFDVEIIVVDNASTDGSDELVERNFPHVRLLRNAKNGCSSGRNLGATATTGDYLVFLDSDQWFTSSAWLFEADHILNHHPIVGAVGWTAGWFDPCLDSLAGPTVDCCARRGHNAEVERCGFRTDVTYLGSGGMFVPRRVWEQCAGFDPSYDPHAFEDTDFSFQVRKAGFKLAYRDLGGIRHQPHQTTRAADADERYVQQFKRNSAYFKSKWADQIELFSGPPEA
jgi:GT2 family glycosyltransferase/glycosyltransferase involved in cell wall biosynthesis